VLENDARVGEIELQIRQDGEIHAVVLIHSRPGSVGERPGALFKFQAQGDTKMNEIAPDDTWLGAPITDREAVQMAERCGFESRYRHGAGEQYFYLWYFKKN